MMSFPHIVLAVTALVFLAFGGWGLLKPRSLAKAVDFVADGPTALVEIRAMYGGFDLGIGLWLAWVAFHPSQFAVGLTATVFMVGGLGAGRLIGLLTTRGVRAVMWGAFAVEAIGTAAAVLALRSLS